MLKRPGSLLLGSRKRLKTDNRFYLLHNMFQQNHTACKYVHLIEHLSFVLPNSRYSPPLFHQICYSQRQVIEKRTAADLANWTNYRDFKMVNWKMPPQCVWNCLELFSLPIKDPVLHLSENSAWLFESRKDSKFHPSNKERAMMNENSGAG